MAQDPPAVELPQKAEAESQPTETSQTEQSQTAQDYIASQLTLEADAREALPYQFDTCTKPLGPLRQSVYACLTCTPPPASPLQQFTPAGVCYSCSISCHGEHTLVELFTKRDFVCDCGTTRYENSGTPCALRPNPLTGRKGGVTGEEARTANRYNQNFQGRFCGCGEEYDPETEKGTMFQCVGLGTIDNGGCGEDWWHPECLMGLPRTQAAANTTDKAESALGTVKEESGDATEAEEKPVENELPPGFPDEDEFDHLICHKCTSAFPWIKQYAGTPGFLPAVVAKASTTQGATLLTEDIDKTSDYSTVASMQGVPESRKRKAEETEEEQESKRSKTEESSDLPTVTTTVKHTTLPAAPKGPINLFATEDFRESLCRCAECFARLSKHPQLLEEEETYEPPISESDAPPGELGSAAGRSVGTGSILDRGEAALSTMDRVKAIEGVMAYNYVRDKVKTFLQPFAETGQAVSAEDIKAYFAKLRGDEQAMKDAASGARANGSVQGDGRREQGGY
jgi:E3 ubiquitin-protein ligase UBR7